MESRKVKSNNLEEPSVEDRIKKLEEQTKLMCQLYQEGAKKLDAQSEEIQQLRQQTDSFLAKHNAPSLRDVSRMIRTLKVLDSENKRVILQKDEIIESKNKIIKRKDEIIEHHKQIIEKQAKIIHNKEGNIGPEDVKLLKRAIYNIPAFFKEENTGEFMRLTVEFQIILNKLSAQRKSDMDRPEFDELGVSKKKFFDIFTLLTAIANTYVCYYSSILDETETNSYKGIEDNKNKKILSLEEIYCPREKATLRKDLYKGILKFTEINDRFFGRHEKNRYEMEKLALRQEDQNQQRGCIVS